LKKNLSSYLLFFLVNVKKVGAIAPYSMLGG
jgi:hypothetical protein